MRVKHIFHTEYELNGRKLQEVVKEKDLGILVTDDLKFSVQRRQRGQLQVLGVIKRNFVLTDEENFRLLFNGFVRPHLEYCVSVWSIW